MTQVGTMYKVQVGAFSVKANAEKLVTDLKSKGYNSFITQVTISWFLFIVLYNKVKKT